MNMASNLAEAASSLPANFLVAATLLLGLSSVYLVIFWQSWPRIFGVSLLAMASISFTITATLGKDVIDPCLEKAASEFGVPAKVLNAMRLADSPPHNEALAARLFGPMGLGEPALLAAQKGANIDPDEAKIDTCQNFRAAAWFLSDARRRAGGDLWQGVGLYYAGDTSTKRRKDLSDLYIARIQKAAGEN
ncbi:hypothetical protein [Pollutimonas bauzanensis]|nr:hypothetical protein [Pollutimonas bauzanensis]